MGLPATRYLISYTGKSRGVFSLVSKLSGKCIDISQGSDSLGEVFLYDFHKGDNQKYNVLDIGQLVSFQSLKSGKLLTIEASKDQNGALVIEAASEGLPSQMFKLQETTPGSQEYLIYTFCGKVLDCCASGTSNGTKIIQWDMHGKPNQIWKLVKIG